MSNTYIRICVFGLLVWLIPFAVSIPFFMPGGLSIDLIFFKSIMIVVGALVSAFLLIAHFKRIERDFLREGILVGLIWFAINIGLDLVILVPMSGQSIGEYFHHIGLRYLVMPITGILIGKVLADQAMS